MRGVVQRLRAEVASDRAALGRWLDPLESLDPAAQRDEGTLAVVAWRLHHAYCAIEAILARVARTIEGGVHEGPDRHKELLDAAALEVEEVRPALLSRQTVVALHELRSFRHFVRCGYTVALDPLKLAAVRAQLLGARWGLEEDLAAIDAWLADVALELSAP